MPLFKEHSSDCSCTSCFYKSEIEKQTNKQILGPNNINLSNLPQRQQKLLQKLAKTRATYDDIRLQLLSDKLGEDSKGVKQVPQTRSGKEIDESEKNILEAVHLIDKGRVGQAPLSDCCSCCSCDSDEHLHKHKLGINKHDQAKADTRAREVIQPEDTKHKIHHIGKHEKGLLKYVRSDSCSCLLESMGLLIHMPKVSKKKRTEQTFPHDVGDEKTRTGNKLKKGYKKKEVSMGEAVRHSATKLNKTKKQMEAGVKNSVENLKITRNKIKGTVNDSIQNLKTKKNLDRGIKPEQEKILEISESKKNKKSAYNRMETGIGEAVRHSATKIKNTKKKVEAGVKKSLENMKETRNKIKGTVNDSMQNIARKAKAIRNRDMEAAKLVELYETTFHTTLSLKDLMDEDEQMQKIVDKWVCDFPCDQDECVPEECLDIKKQSLSKKITTKPRPIAQSGKKRKAIHDESIQIKTKGKNIKGGRVICACDKTPQTEEVQSSSEEEKRRKEKVETRYNVPLNPKPLEKNKIPEKVTCACDNRGTHTAHENIPENEKKVISVPKTAEVVPLPPEDKKRHGLKDGSSHNKKHVKVECACTPEITIVADKKTDKLNKKLRPKTSQTSALQSSSASATVQPSLTTSPGKTPDKKTHLSPSTSQRQSVRIGSSFSFKIEFFKNKPKVEHNSRRKVRRKHRNTMYTPKQKRHKTLGTSESLMDYQSGGERVKAMLTPSHNELLKERRKKADSMNQQTRIRHKISSANQNLSKHDQWTDYNLKRCFCTLKLKSKKTKTRLRNPREQKTSESESKSLQTMKSKNMSALIEFLPCEPTFCTPGQCEPIECVEKTNKRYSVLTNTKYPDRRVKSTPSFTSISRTVATGIGENVLYHETKATVNKPSTLRDRAEIPLREKTSGGPAVCIGSKFSFNIEFYKGDPPNHMLQPNDSQNLNKHVIKIESKGKNYSKNELNRSVKYSSGQLANKYLSRQLANKHSQYTSSVKSKQTFTRHKLRRCFCTLKFLKPGYPSKEKYSDSLFDVSEDKPITSAKKTGTKHNTKQKKLKSRCLCPETKESFQRPIPDVRSAGTMKKLEPYECEPNFCIPGKCDPNICFERIKIRENLYKNFGTTMSRRKQITSGTSSSSLLQSRNACIQSHLKCQQQPSKTLSSNGSSRRQIEVPLENSSSRQVVRIGSNFSLSIEFYKDRKGYQNKPFLRGKRKRRIETIAMPTQIFYDSRNKSKCEANKTWEPACDSRIIYLSDAHSLKSIKSAQDIDTVLSTKIDLNKLHGNAFIKNFLYAMNITLQNRYNLEKYYDKFISDEPSHHSYLRSGKQRLKNHRVKQIDIENYPNYRYETLHKTEIDGDSTSTFSSDTELCKDIFCDNINNQMKNTEKIKNSVAFAGLPLRESQLRMRCERLPRGTNSHFATMIRNKSINLKSSFGTLKLQKNGIHVKTLTINKQLTESSTVGHRNINKARRHNLSDYKGNRCVYNITQSHPHDCSKGIKQSNEKQYREDSGDMCKPKMYGSSQIATGDNKTNRRKNVRTRQYEKNIIQKIEPRSSHSSASLNTVIAKKMAVVTKKKGTKGQYYPSISSLQKPAPPQKSRCLTNNYLIKTLQPTLQASHVESRSSFSEQFFRDKPLKRHEKSKLKKYSRDAIKKRLYGKFVDMVNTKHNIGIIDAKREQYTQCDDYTYNKPKRNKIRKRHFCISQLKRKSKQKTNTGTEKGSYKNNPSSNTQVFGRKRKIFALGSLFQRCLLSLAFRKRVCTTKNRNSRYLERISNESASTVKAIQNDLDLKTYECNPGVCTAAQCDRIIKKRLPRERDISTEMSTIRLEYSEVMVSKSSINARMKKPTKVKIMEHSQKFVEVSPVQTYGYGDKASVLCVAPQSQNFVQSDLSLSFNMSFLNNKLTERKFHSKSNSGHEKELSKPIPRYAKEEKIDLKSQEIRNSILRSGNHSQVLFKKRCAETGIRSKRKRCFCTLPLNEAGHKETYGKKLNVGEPHINGIHIHTAAETKKTYVNVNQSRRNGNNKARSNKRQPNQCDLGVYIPDQFTESNKYEKLFQNRLAKECTISGKPYEERTSLPESRKKNEINYNRQTIKERVLVPNEIINRRNIRSSGVDHAMLSRRSFFDVSHEKKGVRKIDKPRHTLRHEKLEQVLEFQLVQPRSAKYWQASKTSSNIHNDKSSKPVLKNYKYNNMHRENQESITVGRIDTIQDISPYKPFWWYVKEEPFAYMKNEIETLKKEVNAIERHNYRNNTKNESKISRYEVNNMQNPVVNKQACIKKKVNPKVVSSLQPNCEDDTLIKKRNLENKSLKYLEDFNVSNNTLKLRHEKTVMRGKAEVISHGKLMPRENQKRTHQCHSHDCKIYSTTCNTIREKKKSNPPLVFNEIQTILPYVPHKFHKNKNLVLLFNKNIKPDHSSKSFSNAVNSHKIVHNRFNIKTKESNISAKNKSSRGKSESRKQSLIKRLFLSCFQCLSRKEVKRMD